MIKQYGLTPESYEDMLKAQGGACAICKTTKWGKNGSGELSPHIDHDHRTGKVRGLLCRRCNLAIANLDDRPDLFRAAIEYLEKAGA